MYFYTFRDGQRGAPLVTEDVQAYATVGVDVWVIDAGSEVNLRRLERVVRRKMYCQEENTA